MYMRRKGWIWLSAVVGVALTLRVIYLLQLRESPFFDVPIVDERTYLEQAQNIASGELLGGDKPFWQPPLYPYFLALLYRLFGRNFLFLRGSSLVLGALSCGLVFMIGTRAFGRSAGILAGLMAAAYGPFLFFEGMLLPTALGTFLALGTVGLALRAERRKRFIVWGMVGGILGLAALAVGNTLAFLPFLAAWVWRWGGPRRGRLVRIGAILVGASAALLPIAIRNGLVGRDWVLISSNVGVNFYVGNNPEYERTVRLRPGTEWWALTAQAKEAGYTKASEQSRYFLKKSLAFIRRKPLEYIGLLVRKAYQFWRGEEIKRNQDVYSYREFTPLLKVLLWRRGIGFPFGLVGPLSLMGIGLALTYRRREPFVALLEVFVLAFFLSVVAFFPCGRYRVPSVPFLLIFAAYGIWWVYGRVREGRIRASILPTSVFSALVFAVNVGMAEMRPGEKAEMHYNLAYAHAQRGMWASATAEARKAVALDPGYVEPRELLASLAAQRGAYKDAISEYRQVIEMKPDRLGARRSLAHVYFQQGRYGEAIDQYNAILAYSPPDSLDVYAELGLAYLRAGRAEEAISAYKAALMGDSTRVEVLFGLAMAYGEEGEFEKAISLYERVLTLRPEYAEVWNNLGVLFLKRGGFEEAISRLRRAVEIKPDYVGAWYNLTTAYIRTGRYEDALSACQEVVHRNPEYRDGELFKDLAMIYQRLGDRDRAQEAMARYRRYVNRKKVQEVVREIKSKISPDVVR
ncbi:MAG TPA: tetratricopeptide repeat protein [Candidatus Latescibacteria bacterium]|nr:tetratricopeptide repeat protein [Candidatus Latescibacterota bacterium]